MRLQCSRIARAKQGFFCSRSLIIPVRRLTQQSRLDFSINVSFDINGAFDSDLRVNIQLILDRDAELVFDCYIRLHRRLDSGDLGLCPNVA